jgi:hypothetical protein
MRECVNPDVWKLFFRREATVGAKPTSSFFCQLLPAPSQTSRACLGKSSSDLSLSWQSIAFSQRKTDQLSHQNFILKRTDVAGSLLRYLFCPIYVALGWCLGYDLYKVRNTETPKHDAALVVCCVSTSSMKTTKDQDRLGTHTRGQLELCQDRLRT